MYIFVINPQAGNGRAQRLFTQLQKQAHIKTSMRILSILNIKDMRQKLLMN